MSATASVGRARTLRVAIVGLGPKGLFALERLLDRAAALDDGSRIEIDAFERHPVPGAGPVYDPAQPAYLRMNFAADQVDLWWPTGTAAPRGEQRSFMTWRERVVGPLDGDGGATYPPRAEVGRYLADGLATLLQHAPASAAVRLHETAVERVELGSDGWHVLAGDLAGGPYDEVLIATGHLESWDAGLASIWRHPALLVPAVFPVQRWLSRERVSPGATVAVRGFGLSFIDAALALTEGRGGSFEPLDHPWRLRYVPGAGDAALLLPFARSGRPLLAKPHPGIAAGIAGLERVAERGRVQIRLLGDGFALDDVLAIVATAARASLLAATGAVGMRAKALAAAMRSWLADAAAGTLGAAEAAPATAIERSLDVGAGLTRPGREWALGHSWRTLYPALVARLGGDSLSESEWPAFQRLAAELERVAFGPSPLNAAKLLALVEAGRIDLTHVSGGRLVSRDGLTSLRSAQGEQRVDVVLDAVLPGTGAVGGHGPLLGSLLREGHVRVLPGRRGIDVDAAGGCRGADGLRTPGLSAIGRPTEDTVIGNDTLSRSLHPLADRWARRVVHRCRAMTAAAVDEAVARRPHAAVGEVHSAGLHRDRGAA